jgi:hypothetical protein
MKSLKSFSTTLCLKVMTVDLSREDGQGALEYMGMLLGLVLFVFIAFQIIGVNIFDKATSFVVSVLGGTS